LRTPDDEKSQNNSAHVWRFGRRSLLLFLGLATDAALVAFAFYSAYWLRFHFAPLLRLFPTSHGVISPWSQYSSILPTVTLIWLSVLFFGVKIHEEPPLPAEEKIVRILSGSFKATIMVFALSFLSKRYSDSRLLMLFTAPLAVLYLTLGYAFVDFVRRRVLLPTDAQDKLLVIGEGRLADSLIQKISLLRHRQILKKPPLPKDKIAILARAEGIREVLLVQAMLSQEDLISLAEELEFSGIRLRVVPSLLELRIGEIQVDNSLGLPLLYFGHISLSGENFAIKRIFDLCFSILILMFGFFPLLIIAILIKLDSPGPIFYRQKRYGLHRRVFEALKLRTMVFDAESKIEEVKALGAGEAFFKAKNDPRITRVGKIIRRISLDEFPQFWNVFVGDMSVVGPRPLAVTTGELERLKEDFGPAYKKRLNIVPGITGLWQVSGRSELSSEQRFALDIFYIERWSLGLDIKIILMTPYAMISSKGAY
jgi:exopolysaccharide biosynthesis polyprenyl glycosylphosphotransferase